MKSKKTILLLAAVMAFLLTAAAVLVITLRPANWSFRTVPVLPQTGPDANEVQPVEGSALDDSKDFAIAGISPTESAARVLDLLGEPTERKTQAEPSIHNSDYTCYWTTWVYDGLEVVFMTVAENGKRPDDGIGGVFAVMATSGEYRTFRGIKVGDPVSRVIDQYGTAAEGDPSSPDDEELFFETGLHYLRFAVSEGVVTQIDAGQILL